MPLATQYSRVWRVKIGGVVVKQGDLKISQSIDMLTTVAEFSLASRPTAAPEDGDSVAIDWINPGTGRAWAVFRGQVSSIEVDSGPWNFRVRACDILERFRRTKTGSDMNLTGMTEGAAWKAIADACAITYDPADIADTGYVLGGMVPIYWHADGRTPASQIIQELDAVFGMTTQTVGSEDGFRVVRIRLDHAPETTTGLYKTYTKGVSVEFGGHRRVRGDRDAIQNVWAVTGVTEEFDNGCTRTVWARSVSGNAVLGSRRVRVSEQSFSSDLIQSTPLAEAIVRRLMRQTNRLPDVASALFLNDPNVHPGTKVRIIDPTYGLNTGSTGRLFLVRSVDRSDWSMALDLEAGPGGSEGTVTSGAEKVCGDVGTDTGADGDFDPGDFGVPPIDPGFDDGFLPDDGFGDLEPPDLTSPIIGCIDETAFDGSGGTHDTEIIDGEPPEGTCPGDGLENSDWHWRETTRFGGMFEWHVICEIHVPWRQTNGNAIWELDETGAVIAVGCKEDTVGLYANSEVDPDTQTPETDIVYPAPLMATIAGTVTFNAPGSVLQLQWYAVEPDGDEIAVGPEANLYAEPGLVISPPGGTARTQGVILGTDFLDPLLIGDTPPNESHGAGARNNGGYVDSVPATLGVPVSFSVFADETYNLGWGRIEIQSDLGSGHLEHLDYLVQGTVLPGEPQIPAGTCETTHAGHKLRITLIAGTDSTYDAPAVVLRDLVFGHTTCAVNPDYVSPGPES